MKPRGGVILAVVVIVETCRRAQRFACELVSLIPRWYVVFPKGR